MSNLSLTNNQLNILNDFLETGLFDYIVDYCPRDNTWNWLMDVVGIKLNVERLLKGEKPYEY